MTQTVLISKKAEEVNEGDLFVSVFARVAADYPPAERVDTVSVIDDTVTIKVGAKMVNVFKGMLVITKEIA